MKALKWFKISFGFLILKKNIFSILKLEEIMPGGHLV
jgi:hypothetical protein